MAPPRVLSTPHKPHRHMPKRISHLTAAQRARMAPYAQKRIARALDTRRCDRQKGEAAIHAAYRLAGMDPPRTIVWVESPLAVALAGPIAAYLLGTRKGIAVDSAVSSAVHSAVSSAVSPAVSPAVYSAVRSAVDSAVRSGFYLTHGGHLWPAGHAWRAYFLDECDLRLPTTDQAAMHAWTGLVEDTGPSWMHRDFVIVSDRPTEMHRGPNRAGEAVLHCEDGPAIAWGAEWDIYAIEGVCVPKHVACKPESITVGEIEGERNAEVQRIMMERYGMERYLSDVGATVLAMDSVPIESWNESAGSIERALMRTPRGQSYLVACDGSTPRVYVMRAPDDAETPEEAYAAITGHETHDCIAQG